MPDSWSDLDVAGIVKSELSATIEAAVGAWSRDEVMPSSTPLQRAVSRQVVHAWSAEKLEAMRARTVR
jgi:hypothetical protein